MLLGCNKTQPSSLGCFIAFSKASTSLSHASSWRTPSGALMRPRMPTRQTSVVWSRSLRPVSPASKAISLSSCPLCPLASLASRGSTLCHLQAWPPIVDIVILNGYREEFYDGIYLSELRPSIISQIHGSLLFDDHAPSVTTIFFVTLHVTIDMPSSPLSYTLSDMIAPSAIAVSGPWARDNGLPPYSNGDRPRHGCDHNSFLSCRHCGKQNHHANKCCKQFGKLLTAQVVVIPLAAFSLASPSRW